MYLIVVVVAAVDAVENVSFAPVRDDLEVRMPLCRTENHTGRILGRTT